MSRPSTDDRPRTGRPETMESKLAMLIHTQQLPDSPESADAEHIQLIFKAVLPLAMHIQVLSEKEICGEVLLNLIKNDGLSEIGINSKVEQARIKACATKWSRRIKRERVEGANAVLGRKRPKNESFMALQLDATPSNGSIDLTDTPDNVRPNTGEAYT